MGGSLPALFVVPSVLPIALCTWLGLVVWVGAHRDWKVHRLAREAALETATPGTAGPEAAALEAAALEAAALETAALETAALETEAREAAPGKAEGPGHRTGRP